MTARRSRPQRIAPLIAFMLGVGCTKEALDRIDPPVCNNPKIDCTCFDPKTRQGCSDNWFEDYMPSLPPIGAPSAPDAGSDTAASDADTSCGDSR